MQQRGAAAAHFLDGALKRRRHFGGVADFFRIGAKRLADLGEIDPEAFNASQKQMEEQSQILSELVATLGVLDEHMQQIKSEIGQGKVSGM